MEYLADTVAIIRYFSGTGRIGKDAKKILKEADLGENIVYISIISMVEIMYLAEANRIPVDFNSIKNHIIGSANYRMIDLSLEIVEEARRINELELHDRLIVATGIYLNIPILTCDQSILDSDSITAVWG